MAVGCYTPRYLTARFKGVAFICIEAESEHGRRGAEGEFPFGENTAYADLGRRIRNYSLKAVFRENSHIKDSGRLIKACESPGPGTLVHPTRGSLQAACKSIKVHDDIENGQGETTCDLTFVEANDWLGGFNIGSGLAGINLGPVTTALNAYFSRRYNVAQKPFFARPVIRDTAAAAIGTIRSGLASASGIQSDGTFWKVASELDGLASNPIDAAVTDRAWLGISGGFASIDRYGTNPSIKIQSYRSIANWAAVTPAIPVLAADSIDAIMTALRVLSAGYIAKSATEIPVNTMQDAFRQYDMVVALIGDEMTRARSQCEDELYLALRDFLVEAQTALLTRAFTLPPVVQYKFYGGVSSLTAAHEIYGDAKQFGTIESYNSLQFPWHVGPDITAPRPPEASGFSA